jgi:hypothetical protein
MKSEYVVVTDYIGVCGWLARNWGGVVRFDEGRPVSIDLPDGTVVPVWYRIGDDQVPESELLNRRLVGELSQRLIELGDLALSVTLLMCADGFPVRDESGDVTVDALDRAKPRFRTCYLLFSMDAMEPEIAEDW